MSEYTTRPWLLGGFLLMSVWSLGCTSGASVAVPTEFPIPVVEPIPLTMGIVLDEALTSYSHTEEIESRGTWVIDIGSAQSPMFNNLFKGLFSEYRQLGSVAEADSAMIGIIEPSIEELQFSTPKQTRSDYFEVWIRYTIKLYESDGSLVGEWPLTAYGKANERNYGLSSRQPALQAAALAACRDAMAFFAIQFRTVPVVKSWLEPKLKGVG